MFNESVIIDDKSFDESPLSDEPVHEIMTNKQKDDQLNKSSVVICLKNKGIKKL
ncbi:MAG: hypothetical protein GY820_42655 [Gammaproteobacteria bacterium]|nr:hypothetical protein [Gammaproteobacteria bacterium]